MIEERFCSYEVAMLLKEKGFDELCENIYFDKGLMDFVPDMFDDERWVKNSDFPDSYLVDCTAPTHQMAMKWLREKGICITAVYGDYPALNKIFWTPQIDSIKGFDLPDDFYKDYDKYEDAIEAALKYVLKNLI